MKSRTLTCITALTLFAALAAPAQLAAQHTRYKLIDMGTFGGPASKVNNGGDGNNLVNVLNNRGELVGWAETPKHDPFDPACLDEACKIIHAFEWQQGIRTDLGTLPKGLSSQANWISANGLVAGLSEYGGTDPLFPGFPETHAVLWQKGRITDLGTLPEGGYESFGNAVNSAGQVVGLATNTVLDAYSMAGPGYFPTESRAFLWQNGVMQDLGTLGGPDALAAFVNEKGQVVGMSYTSSAPNTSCPFLLPLATGSFIWDEKNGMRDLGTLGGTCVIATGVNDQGVVVGDNINDQPLERGFLWRDGIIQGLGGSIGGEQTTAEGINQSGQVIGVATLAGEILYHATLWRRVSEITDLGVLEGDMCSFPSSINSKAQVVGASHAGTPLECTFDNTTRAFLWEDGSIFDLNALIPSGASLHLQWAQDINDRGEIAGSGLDASGNLHAFLLIPCAPNNPSDCQEIVADTAGTTPVGLEPLQGPTTLAEQSSSPSRLLRQRLRFGPVVRGPQRLALNNPAVISAPNATLSPAGLTFATDLIGSASAAKSVALTNHGTSTLSIAGIATTGDFSQTHTCGSSLAAGASCTISISFKPTQIGTRTGKLSVTDNASGSPQSVSLSGTGTVAKLAPASLTFATQLVNTSSAGEAVTVTNTATTSLSIAGIETTGDFSQPADGSGVGGGGSQDPREGGSRAGASCLREFDRGPGHGR
jgi:probable HAF family extracellular repeat protein